MAMIKIVIVLVCVTWSICCAHEPCGTCREHGCGSYNEFCGCDAMCKVYNDCCTDFESVCNEEIRKVYALTRRFPGIAPDDIARCHSVNHGAVEEHVLLVKSCSADEQACDPGNSTSPLDLVPVTENSTGLNFINAECARCNGVTQAMVWNTKLLCDEEVYVKLGVANATAVSTEVHQGMLKTLLNHPQCSLSIIIPIEAKRPCDMNIIDSCTDGSRYNQQHCRFGTTGYMTDGRNNYKNHICATCNSVPDETLFCGLAEPFNVAGIIYGKFSLSLLLDFRDTSGLLLQSGECEDGFTKVGGHCLPIVCPEDYVLVGSDCAVIPKLDISIHFHVSLNPGKAKDKVRTILKNPEFLRKNVEEFLEKLYDKISNNSLSFNTSGAIEHYSVHGFLMSIPGLIEYTVHNMSRDSIGAEPPLTSLGILINETLKNYLDQHIGLDISRSLNVEMEELELDDEEEWDSSMSCTQVRLTPEQFISRNQSIFIISSGQSLELNLASFDAEGNALVCKSDLLDKPASSTSYLGITSIVVLSISLLCLLVRLVLQFFISAYHTSPMRLQFCLCLCLFTGFLCFLLNPFFGEGTVQCHVLGIYIHWVFLSAFCWKMVVAFDMWWIFRPSGGFTKISDGEGFFWRYFFVAVLTSSVVTAISLIFEYTDINMDIKPEYGRFLCFFNNTRALFIFFVIPLIIVVLVNLIFFVMTCVNLHRALSSIQKFQKQKWQQELCLYIRLFSLMGITWVFGIVAPLVTSNDILWYFFIIFNGLQGLYIFLAYVCTSKVYSELKRQCCGMTRRTSRQTTSDSMVSRSSSNRRQHKYKPGDSSDTTDGNRTTETSAGDSFIKHEKTSEAHGNAIQFTNGNTKIPSETVV